MMQRRQTDVVNNVMRRRDPNHSTCDGVQRAMFPVANAIGVDSLHVKFSARGVMLPLHASVQQAG